MKKLTPVFLVLALVFALCSCSFAASEEKKGYMTNNDICTQDEYEQTLFGQPISTERNGEIRLGIKCTHDSYAEVTVYEAQDGKYVPIFNCPAVIGKNGPAKHAEGVRGGSIFAPFSTRKKTKSNKHLLLQFGNGSPIMEVQSGLKW